MSDKIIEGVWGRSTRSKRVHFYRGERSMCGQSEHLDMDFPDGWDENDPRTCKQCIEWVRWMKKGARKLTQPAQDNTNCAK